MNEEERLKTETLAGIDKKYPFIKNMTTVAIIEKIKDQKARLYDLQKSVAYLEELNSKLELAMLFRPIEEGTHYFDNMDRYRINDKKV